MRHKLTCLLLLAGFAVFVSDSIAGADLKREQALRGYCDRPVVRDFEAPLRHLPFVESLGPGGQLPFAPAGVHLSLFSRPINQGLIVVISRGYSRFGYEIVRSTKTTVNWSVRSSLTRLAPTGGEEEVAAEASDLVDLAESAASSRFVLPVPTRPGPYRYDIRFSDVTGMPLGQYSEYLQVLRPKLAFRLGIRGRSFRPGHFLYSRWENLGSQLIEFTSVYWIERKVDGQWTSVPNVRPTGRGFPPEFRVGGGRASQCMKVWLPHWLPKGVYRLGRAAGRSRLDPGMRIPPRHIRTATFLVR